MSIIDDLQWRYATKKFDADRILSEEKIKIIKQAFNLTATSFGLQTVRLMVVENRTLRKQLVDFSFGQKQVEEASDLLVICIQKNITDADVDSLFDDVAETRNTPEAILKPYREDLRALMDGKSIEERRQWSIKQAYIVLGNLMTVCATEKIDACPMEGFVPEKYDEILKLNEQGLMSVLVMPVGYRADDDMFADFKKVRKDIEDVTLAI